MIQVWKYDENKIFTVSEFVDEVTENMTTVHLLVGYVKPKFTSEEWIEGATPQEIAEWEEANRPKPSEPTEIELLQQDLAEQLEYTVDLDFRLSQIELIGGM